MELKVLEDAEKYVRIALVGRLDVAGVQAVDLQFIRHVSSSKKPTIVDMSEVSYLASLAVRMLLRALGLAAAKVILFKPQPLVEEILRVSGVDDFVAIVSDEARAREMAMAT